LRRAVIHFHYTPAGKRRNCSLHFASRMLSDCPNIFCRTDQNKTPHDFEIACRLVLNPEKTRANMRSAKNDDFVEKKAHFCT
jgi:hypothetical protein